MRRTYNFTVDGIHYTGPKTMVTREIFQFINDNIFDTCEKLEFSFCQGHGVRMRCDQEINEHDWMKHGVLLFVEST